MGIDDPAAQFIAVGRQLLPCRTVGH